MKTKATHTSGPLHVVADPRNENDFRDFHGYRLETAEGWITAEEIANKADATLYAAAPAMLEALREAYDYAVDPPAYEPQGGNVATLIEMLRAAIAEAE
jgi:hypothetical protein